MRKALLGAALLSCLAFAAPASAQVIFNATPGANSYAGPPVTYDFETAAPTTFGLVTTGSLSGVRAQPVGSTGNYWTVGPSDGSPGFLDLRGFASINQVSFIWGSVDAYNSLDVLDRVGGLLASYTGLDASVTADGNQTVLANNPLATLAFLGDTRTNIGWLRLSSTSNAFEIDNVSVLSIDTFDGAVPEPATWAMILLGFGAIGASLRTRKAKFGTRLRAV